MGWDLLLDVGKVALNHFAGRSAQRQANQYAQDVHDYNQATAHFQGWQNQGNTIAAIQQNWANANRQHHWQYITAYGQWVLSEGQNKHNAVMRGVARDAAYATQFNQFLASEQSERQKAQLDNLRFGLEEIQRAAEYHNAATSVKIQNEKEREGIEGRNWQRFQNFNQQQQAVRLADIQEDVRYQTQANHNEAIRGIASYAHDTAMGEIGAQLVAQQAKHIKGNAQARRKALAEGGQILAQGQSGVTTQKLLLSSIQDRLVADQVANQNQAINTAGAQAAQAAVQNKLKEDLLSQKYTARRKFFDPVLAPLETHIDMPRIPPMAKRAAPPKYVRGLGPLQQPYRVGHVPTPPPMPGPKPADPEYPKDPLFGGTVPRPPGVGGGDSALGTIASAIEIGTDLYNVYDKHREVKE